MSAFYAFVYEALDSKGENCSGIINSKSETDAIQALRHKGLYPTKVTRSSRKEDPEIDAATLREAANNCRKAIGVAKETGLLLSLENQLSDAARLGKTRVWKGFFALPKSVEEALTKKGFTVGTFFVSF